MTGDVSPVGEMMLCRKRERHWRAEKYSSIHSHFIMSFSQESGLNFIQYLFSNYGVDQITFPLRFINKVNYMNRFPN